ncbi:MAG TPA: hypothetical protein VMG81_07360 [Thermoplasmata archaeon]|nr:hypothetical protein [Thermoplasmata archaeon]
MAGPDLTIWIPILATWVLALGTLAFAYWQIRLTRKLHSTSTLLDLRERFYSPRLREARRELARWLIDPRRLEEPANWEVPLFFEFAGTLTRSGVLDRHLVRKGFGPWITAYYTFMRRPDDLIGRWRKEGNDPLIFADFEWLALQVTEMERRAAPGPLFDQSLLEEATYVLQGDAQLPAAGGSD